VDGLVGLGLRQRCAGDAQIVGVVADSQQAFIRDPLVVTVSAGADVAEWPGGDMAEWEKLRDDELGAGAGLA
jgi:hypothetical protein